MLADVQTLVKAAEELTFLESIILSGSVTMSSTTTKPHETLFRMADNNICLLRSPVRRIRIM